MRVSRRIAVDGVEGYELTGPLGTARLAWHGTRLVAQALGGTTYDPPIPLLDSRLPQAPVEWRGTVTAPVGICDGAAKLRHYADHTQFASKQTPAIETVLELQAGKRRIELRSWFIYGVGLAKQEEHTGDVQTVRLSMTGGP